MNYNFEYFGKTPKKKEPPKNKDPNKITMTINNRNIHLPKTLASKGNHITIGVDKQKATVIMIFSEDETPNSVPIKKLTTATQNLYRISSSDAIRFIAYSLNIKMPFKIEGEYNKELNAYLFKPLKQGE